MHIDLAMFINNLPGGVMCCEYNEPLTLRYYSKGFLDLFGYTDQEITEIYHDSFRAMIYENDIEPCLTSVAQQMAVGNSKVIEYRCYHKSGRLIWIHDRGQLIHTEDGKSVFFCILLDVTESKENQEKLQLSLERHQIISNQTNDIIFEWDAIHDTLSWSSNWQKKFGIEPVMEHARSSIMNASLLHPDSVPNIRKLSEGFEAGESYGETECMLATRTGEYLWCRLRATAQKNKDGELSRIVGVIIDIDAEKRKTDLLAKQARRDSLTNIYNKMTASERIDRRLKERADGTSYVLMLFDIDNFKRTNDTYGHMFGDQCLVQLTTALQKVLPDSAILGRIGGDEFIAFFEYPRDFNVIKRYADSIISTFVKKTCELHAGACVSCSIGIVCIPEDGCDFQTLYEKSDQALYRAKRDGKARYAIFSEK